MGNSQNHLELRAGEKLETGKLFPISTISPFHPIYNQPCRVDAPP